MTTITTTAVYLESRRGIVIKHHLRSDQKFTLCGEPLKRKVGAQTLNRECVACRQTAEALARDTAAEMHLVEQPGASADDTRQLSLF